MKDQRRVRELTAEEFFESLPDQIILDNVPTDGRVPDTIDSLEEAEELIRQVKQRCEECKECDECEEQSA